MQKEQILESSRKENQNKDLAGLEVLSNAGYVSSIVGGVACCVILVLGSIILKTVLYSPWFIYFSMLGANWLIRSIKLKKKSDLVLTGLFIILAILSLIGFVIKLVEVAV